MQVAQIQVADLVVHATSQGEAGTTTTPTATGDAKATTVVTPKETGTPIAMKPKATLYRRHQSSVSADNTIAEDPLAVATTPVPRIATPSPLHPFTQSISNPVQPYATRQSSVVGATATPLQQPTSSQRADSPFDDVMHVDESDQQEQADDEANQPAQSNVVTPGVATAADSAAASGGEEEPDNDDDDVVHVIVQPGEDEAANDSDDDAEVDADIEQTITVVDGVPVHSSRSATLALPPPSQATPGNGAQAARAAWARGEIPRKK